MINQERISAIQRLGYSEPEARFLCTAALHGGYFLRRQYSRFLGREDGGTVNQLVERALLRDHAKASTWCRKIHVYHLCSRPFYDAIGQSDNRNRRRRQPFTIKNKLMGLDFVLDHPSARYLATEQEKVAFFTESLQVPIAALPAKEYRARHSNEITARYFVDKHPIFVPGDVVMGPSSVVSFCFVDEGQTTVSHFETYLTQYGPLFSFLSQFSVIYVAASPAPFERARRAFERHLKVWTYVASTDPEVCKVDRLVQHFEARRQFEARELTSFDRAKLLRYRDECEEFSGPKYEALYERWQANGGRGLLQTLAPKAGARNQISGSFSTYLLQHDYDIFGTAPAS